jgi:hypothetical protein
MCQFASLVLTKDKALWLPNAEAHQAIIRHYGLHVDGARGPNIVKVEILPPGGAITLDPAGWVVQFDQDVFPEWHDAAESARRARAALPDKLVNLTTLDASYTQIKDVSALVNLTTLDASDTQIKDVSALVNLTTLYARGSNIKGVGKQCKVYK